MERSLKERIIGAAVLVIFVVLVVPVFLDGSPQNGEVISERVPLPGQAGEQKTQTIVLQRDRKEPVPLAASNEPVAKQAAREEPPAKSTERPTSSRDLPNFSVGSRPRRVRCTVCASDRKRIATVPKRWPCASSAQVMPARSCHIRKRHSDKFQNVRLAVVLLESSPTYR